MNNEKMLQEQLSQFEKSGYCVVPNVLSSEMLTRLQTGLNEDKLSHTSKDNFGDSGGFLVVDYKDPTMVELLTWPETLDTLSSLGFNSPKLHNFYVSTKPPHADALPWHSDLFYRYEAE